MKKMLFKSYLVAVLSILFLITSAGFVFAYLSYFTQDIKNGFTVDEHVSLSLQETVSNSKKSDVFFINNQDYAVYIRACILVNWKKEDGVSIYGIPPVANTDYALLLNNTDWVKIGDFYYYRKPVNSNGETTNLIEEFSKINTSPDNYPILSVEIVAQAIQAIGNTGVEGLLPVEESWTVTVDENGNIVN